MHVINWGEFATCQCRYNNLIT
uniref:Uncharacterized protein n=1 Tax=Rhizophora mucronata TaxID=61149 RepID=A0A2P2NF94_RHIMU